MSDGYDKEGRDGGGGPLGWGVLVVLAFYGLVTAVILFGYVLLFGTTP